MIFLFFSFFCIFLAFAALGYGDIHPRDTVIFCICRSDNWGIFYSIVHSSICQKDDVIDLQNSVDN